MTRPIDRLTTTIWTHRQTTKSSDLGQLWTCLVKPIKDLIPNRSCLSPRAIYKSPFTGEAINKKLYDKVLTRVIHEFYIKQPGTFIHWRSQMNTFSHWNDREAKDTDFLLKGCAVYRLRRRFRLGIWSADCPSLFIDAWQFETNKQNWQFSDGSCFRW